ncbi:uncharacterized protein LOC121596049 [Anopheles merus]|nr:uncharacterized protein LOC121596049 [Anopheles merus]
MNMRVSELTEIALQMMGYKLFDRNGTPTDSLEAVIEKHQYANDHQMALAKPANKRKNPNPPTKSEQQFASQFELPDFDTILTNPVRYVDGQLVSFEQQQQQRLAVLRMQDNIAKPKVKSIRASNLKQISNSKQGLETRLMRTYKAMSEADETELLSRTKYDLDIGEHIQLKQGLLLREFNVLLQLLKRVMDDLFDNYAQFDFAWLMMRKLDEMLKSAERTSTSA